MLNPLGTWLLLGGDSACASAAIRLFLPRENVKWQLPVAFAVCDGLGALLGSAISPAYYFGVGGSLAISCVAVAAVAGLLLAHSKMPSGTRFARICRGGTLLAIPLLLAGDNFLAGKSSDANLSVAAIVAGTGATSFLMSVVGLAVGEFAGARFERFGRIALMSAALLLLAVAA